MAWFSFGKKEVPEISGEQLYGQRWAESIDEKTLSLKKIDKTKLPSRACDVALLYDEMRLVAVMLSPIQAPAEMVRRLMEALPGISKGYHLVLPQVNGAWLEQLITGLQPFYVNLPTGQLLVFLEPQLYAPAGAERVAFIPSIINHPLPYFLLAPRMKQGHKVVSFKATSLQYSSNWQEPVSALLKVTLSYQGVSACYYVAVAAGAVRSEIWQKVIPVLIAQAGRHTKACWQIELVSFWVAPKQEVIKGFVYKGVVRYSEPYEAQVALIIPTAVLQLWVKALSLPAERKQMLPAGSTVLRLFQWISALSGQSEVLKPLWWCAASGNYTSLTGAEGQVSVPEILRIIDTVDAKLLIENFLLARYSQRLRALMSYEEKNKDTGKFIIRMGTPDWFKSDFMQYLPTLLRGEWEQQKPSSSFAEWQDFNECLLVMVLEAVAQKRLELRSSTLRVLQQLIIEPRQKRAKELFEYHFNLFYIEVWRVLLGKRRAFLVQKLNNRQWAQILVGQPQLLLELYPYISQRRALYIEEELTYLQHALQVDYAEAQRSLALLTQHK
jgi:hypothetical protein